MILRRFMKHVKDQNWFAVGLDALVVVFGVYVGIFLGDLETKRKFDQESLQTLFALRDELKSDMIRLDEVIDFQNEKNDRTREAVTTLESDGELPPDLGEKVRIALGDNFTFYPNRSAYQTLTTAGYLAAYPDQELRMQISRLYERTYVRQDYNAVLYDNMLFDFTTSSVSPYWDLQKGVLLVDTPKARAIFRNALWSVLWQGDFYRKFLEVNVRTEMQKTIDMIDVLDRDQ